MMFGCWPVEGGSVVLVMVEMWEKCFELIFRWFLSNSFEKS